MKVIVTLNGGPKNVWHQWGLNCNPFPHLARYEESTANRMLQQLDSDPLPDAEAIRRILKGCDPKFIDLCVQNFEPGSRVAFTVSWPDR